MGSILFPQVVRGSSLLYCDFMTGFPDKAGGGAAGAAADGGDDDDEEDLYS